MQGDIPCRPKAQSPVASGDQIGRPYVSLDLCDIRRLLILKRLPWVVYPFRLKQEILTTEDTESTENNLTVLLLSVFFADL